jgi:hypothetical protein
MKLSCILAGIRPGNWLRLYDSIASSFSGEWELIIISPYDLPKDIKDRQNIKLIKDFGSPVRCMDIGLENCSGEFITWAADDGYFLGQSLDIAVASLEGKENHVVVGKYYEGAGDNPFMNSKSYYYINYHDGSRSRFIDNNCLMVMEGVVPANLLREMGGWDAENFEVCPMAFCDLSVRLFRKGCSFIFQEENMFKCSHMPGHEGDHGPVHDAQVEHDEPRFKSIYKSEIFKDRVFVSLDNWKTSSDKWTRRFK